MSTGPDNIFGGPLVIDGVSYDVIDGNPNAIALVHEYATGSEVVDLTTGTRYVNMGTAAVPDWRPLLANDARPTFNDPALPATIYIGDWSADGGGVGDDLTGDGTLAAPYATVAHVITLIAISNPATITLQLAGGPSEAARQAFVLPGQLTELNWITIQGTERDAETMVQTGVAVQADEEALIVDVTGVVSGGAVIDDLRGRLIQWTSGAANNRRGWIRHNDVTGTTAPGVTRLTVSQDDVSSLRVPVNGNTLKLIELCSEVQIPQAFTVIQGSVQHNYRSLYLTDGAAAGAFALLLLDTDKIGLRDVRTEISRVQAGRHSGVEYYNCYVANYGNASRGLLSVLRGGDCQIIRGTVVDGDLNAVVNNNRFVEIAPDGAVSYDGNCVFMGLNSSGIRCSAARIASAAPLVAHYAWSFDTCDAGIVINSTNEGMNGDYFLPNIHGTVASDYAVRGQDGARIHLGPSSNIASGLGVNKVSADGGVSNIATNSDGGIIEHGDPPSTGFGRRYSRQFDDTDLAAGILTVAHNLGAQFVSVAVYDNANVSAGPFPVDVSAGALSCTIDLSTVAPIAGNWNVVVIG